MEAETREQKLVFCLAANCQRLKRILNVSTIAQALIERGVVSENALQKVGRLVGQHTSLNPTLNLLRALFDALSHRNEERKHNLSVFVLAARRRNDDVISSCLPSLHLNEYELNELFFPLKRTSSPFEIKQTLADLDESDCLAFLESILHESSRSDRKRFQNLLAHASQAMNFESVSKAARKLSLQLAVNESHSLEQVQQSFSTALLSIAIESYDVSIYEFATEEVNRHWKALGVFLDFSKPELDSMEHDGRIRQLTSKELAWNLVSKYVQENGPSEVLLSQLRKCLEKVVPRNEEDHYDEKTWLRALPKQIKNNPPLFGREGQPHEIETFFWSGRVREGRVKPSGKCKIQVLSGPGGMGKSSLAYCYAFQFCKEYRGGVYLLSSETSASLLSSLRQSIRNADLLQGGDGKITSNPSLDEDSRLFQKYIKDQYPSLIIFDNADIFELISDFLPDSEIPCHVLITTRCQDITFPPSYASISVKELDSLKEMSAVNALLSWTGNQDYAYVNLNSREQEFAARLAKEPPIEGLPIALAHAGTTVGKLGLSLEAYWTKLSKKAKMLDPSALDLETFLRYFHLSHVKPLLRQVDVVRLKDLADLDLNGVELNSREHRLLAKAKEAYKSKCLTFLTWDLDLEEIEKDSPEGHSILQCCAFLSPYSMPEDVIAQSKFIGTSHAEYQLARGRKALKEKSLIQILVEDNDMRLAYSMHHMIQASYRDRLEESHSAEILTLLEEIGNALLHLLPNVKAISEHITDVRDTDLLRFLPHVNAVAQHMLETEEHREAYLDVIEYAIELSATCGLLEEAERLCRHRYDNFSRKWTLCVSRSRTEKLRTKFCYDLSVAQFNLREYAKAESSLMEAFEGRKTEQFSDTDIKKFWNELEFLAKVYCRLGSSYLPSANKLLQRMIAVAQVVQISPSAEFDVYVTLSLMYCQIGDIEKEMEALKKATTFEKSDLLDESLAYCYKRLGSCQTRLGQFEKAEACYRESLKISKNLYPEGHIQIGVVLLELSECLQQGGKPNESLSVSREALTIARSFPNYPLLPKCLKSYALKLIGTGDLRKAVECQKESLALLEKGSPGPDLERQRAEGLVLLGTLLMKLKRDEEAFSNMQKSGKIFDILVSSDANYRYTNLAVVSFNKIATCYWSANQRENALKWYGKAAKYSERAEDSTFIQSATNFVRSLSFLRKFDEAEVFLRDAVKRQLSRRSHEHLIVKKLSDLQQFLLEKRRN